nr:peroxiredoxin [uncultured Cellulosilyticum sp.]
MIEPNEFKGENMMHSIKSMGKCDSDNDDESVMKKEKKQKQEQDKKQMKDMDYNKKEGKQQEFGWNTDWSTKIGKESECEKKQEKKEMNKCEPNKCEPNKKYSKAEMCKGSKMEKMSEGNMNMGMKCIMMQENMKPCKGVTIGDKMPKMKVQTTMGNKTLPDDYLGKWLILFSHPGDFTPVCTTEFVSFAKNYENFKQLDTELLGLSVDQVQPHIKWVEWIEQNLCTPIPFPIIADSMGKVASELGMVHSAKTTQTVRAVFFVDPTGTIRMILYYPSEVGRNMEEIIRALAALQIADKHKVAMPANWPNNELIGDQVIVPPATTIEGAEKNKTENCCYDWWFCYKPLE